MGVSSGRSKPRKSSGSQPASSAKSKSCPVSARTCFAVGLNPVPTTHLHTSSYKPKLVDYASFFYCIAELAVKPCRSSRTDTRSNPMTLAKQETNKTQSKRTSKQTNKTPTQTTSGKCHWMVRQVVKKSEKNLLIAPDLVRHIVFPCNTMYCLFSEMPAKIIGIHLAVRFRLKSLATYAITILLNLQHLPLNSSPWMRK